MRAVSVALVNGKQSKGSKRCSLVQEGRQNNWRSMFSPF